MKLKCIVLDGFKSYAHRQELDNLDPHFNAITGLNGSGKSNIFDAICFVMGITNLKKVRADDTRDLIYKNGNAGIQRASVTLEFLNDDDATSPPGYSVKDFPQISVARQVICGGKQKFFLNGRIAQQSTIKAFFHSVSMNVDNPHFLVLQGTVHKLLNMKPVEVLSWIEEAAGTRMFDARKRVAEHMIASKEKKLEEINQTLEGEVAVMIEAMGAEQIEYDNYVKISESIERKKRFKVAYRFWTNDKTIEKARDYLSSSKGELEAAHIELAQNPGLLSQAKETLSMYMEKQQESALGNQSTHLAESLRDKRQAFYKAKTELCLLEKNKCKQEDAHKKAEVESAEHEKLCKTFGQQADKHDDEFEKLQEEKKVVAERIGQLKSSIQILKSGLHAGECGMTLVDEQNFIQQKVIELNSSISGLRNEHHAMGNDLVTLEKRHSHAEDTITQQLERIEILDRQVKELQKGYQDTTKGIDSALVNKLDEQCQKLRAQKEKLSSEGNFSLCHFAYDLPQNGVYHEVSKNIYGRAGSFVRAREPSLHSLALSVGARDNLRKVIVSNGETAQYLIERCNTRERTTYFVLDSLKSVGVIDATKQQMAFDAATEQTAKLRAQGNTMHECWARLAIELISYPQNMKLVMEQVFGRFFVCSDLNTARAVALGQAKSRAVTIDGDIVEPGGTFTGGSFSGLRDTLQIFAKFHEHFENHKTLGDEILRLERDRKVAADKFADVENQRVAWESAQTDLQVQRRMCEENEKEKQMLNTRRLEITEAQKKHTDSVFQLESQMAAQESRLKEVVNSLKTNIDPIKKQEEYMSKMKALEARKQEIAESLQVRQTSYDKHVSRKEELDTAKETLRRRMADISNDLSVMATEQEEKNSSIKSMQYDISQIEEELQRHQCQFREHEIGCHEATVEYQHLQEKEASLRRRVMQIESEIRNTVKSTEAAQAQNQDLQKLHPFIGIEKSAFGLDGSDEYYFTDAEHTSSTLHSLAEDERKLEILSKKVNKKVKFMLEESKKEYTDLSAQKDALLKDKEVILKTIEQVEEKKWRSLDIMVQKVSAGFSSLFGTSLPGATCRLVEQRENGRLRGLEVKVAFQGKEKESLTELSGGQRSLLALCLILAILKFRPAPVYILDEIDAALDPSHTENIGKMLQLHFQTAQFLLVSLKDGMFGSANIIYEVRHTQGFSEIRRRINKSKQL